MMICPSCNGSGVSVGTYPCMLCNGSGGVKLSDRADAVLAALHAQAARHHIATSINITLRAAIEVIEAYKAEEATDGPQD